MPTRELTTAAPVPRGHDSAIQVVTTLPVRPRRHESRKGGQPDAVSDLEGRSRIPRIARLMALAIKFQVMVERGEVRDYADIARLGYVTRARLTQIMNLLLLAPTIQEDVLQMKGQSVGKPVLSERDLRTVTRIVEWGQQNRAWGRLENCSTAGQLT
jgi:hypothetical protein